MRPKKRRNGGQLDLFRARFDQMVSGPTMMPRTARRTSINPWSRKQIFPVPYAQITTLIGRLLPLIA
jgi:hypothetical protein